ncbi:MAG: HYR domain-containing protein [Kineosporiaceae bacterium]
MPKLSPPSPRAPRRRLRGLAVVAVVSATLASAGPALADVLTNTVTLGGNDTIVAGESTTISYALNSSDGAADGNRGCNATQQAPVTLSPVVPAKVTATAVAAQITNCGASTAQFTFTASTPGDYAIGMKATGGIGGSFVTTGAAFTLHVKPKATDTTGPVLTLPASSTVQATGASGAPLSWTATAYDAGDAASRPVTCSATSGATFPLGASTVTCSSTDSKGNSSTGSFTVTVVDTLAPQLTLADVTAEATGPTGALVSFPATAADVVDGALPVTCTPASGTRFALGTTTVACAATDSRGNKATGTLAVRVLDRTKPSLVLTSRTVEATGPWGGPAEITATATDLVDGALAVSCERSSGVFAIGTTPVPCTATDAAGNTATGVLTITVTDTTAPALTLQSTSAEATGPDGASVAYAASANDVVSGAVDVHCVPPSGSVFALGATTVACSASDAVPNTATGELNVTVTDTTPPVLSLTDVTAEATSGAGADVELTTSALDLVDGARPVGCDRTSGSTFAPGDTVVTCTSTDRHGNTARGSFTVHVLDRTAPTLAVADTTAEAAGPAGAKVTYTASARDAVSGDVAPVCVPASGATFALGDTTVTCTATDKARNAASASFTVTVGDTTAPAFTGQDVDAEATSAAGATVTFPTTGTDLVDGDVAALCAPAPGSTFPIGRTTVTCSVRDAHHNLATSAFTVTVADTTAPVLTLTGDTREATGPAGATATFEATATDTVDGDVDVTCDATSGATFPLGTTTVHCAATDASGNTAEGTLPVTVRDTTGPALSLADRTVEATGPAGAEVAFTPAASDLVDGDTDVTCDAASGATFALGVTTVTCRTADSRRNDTTGTFTVTVGDHTAPSLTLTDAEAEATGPSGAHVAFTTSATDVVDGDRPVTCDPSSGSLFDLGVTPVGCAASDTRGNEAKGSLKVTVKDSTPPVLTVQGAVVEATGPRGAKASFEATAADLVDGDVDVTCDATSGATFPLGTTTVRCTAKDAAGNTGKASLTVEVLDTTAPVLHLPAGVTAEASTADGAKVTYAATASDLVDGDVDVRCTPASGARFALGDTGVSCTATDAAGNAADARFTVSVVDTTAPVVTVTGATAEATGPAGAAVGFTATAVDSVSGTRPVSCTPASGAVFALGTTEVACTATDAAGNIGSGTGAVRVLDTTAPTLTVPADLTVSATSASGAPVTFAAKATDLVDAAPSVTCSTPSGATFALGTTTVTCSARDAAGNVSAQKSFRVTVRYAFSGVLQPVNADGSSVFKLGSTVPVKFAVTAGGAPVSTVIAHLGYAKVSGVTPGTFVEATSTAAATTGDLFRYDAAAGQYIFNLSTKAMAEGQYLLRVDLGDGVERTVAVTLRK